MVTTTPILHYYPTRPILPPITTAPATLRPNPYPKLTLEQAAALDNLHPSSWKCSYRNGSKEEEAIREALCNSASIAEAVEYASFPIPEMSPCQCPCCKRTIQHVGIAEG
mmetsp:Transcript_1913/g.3515  ORF Transcript_1913/g.3515 Transcript_1913/m.3515 type:complete len:110 (-) Transcript_1913:46-375(-)